MDRQIHVCIHLWRGQVEVGDKQSNKSDERPHVEWGADVEFRETSADARAEHEAEGSDDSDPRHELGSLEGGSYIGDISARGDR